MAEKCFRCRTPLTAENTKDNGYVADRYGIKGRICDRCAWLEEEYQAAKMRGEFDGE